MSRDLETKLRIIADVIGRADVEDMSGSVRDIGAAAGDAQSGLNQLEIDALAEDIDRVGLPAFIAELERLAAQGGELAPRFAEAARELRALQQGAAGGGNALGGMANDAGAAKRELREVGAEADALQTSLKKVAAAVGGLFAVGKLAGYAGDAIAVADAYGQMASRIEQATSSQEEYELVQRRLLATASATYRPLAEAQELYIRTADALRALGYTTEQALDVSDSFSYLLVTNAASAERAASAVDAYSKSIQAGRVDAQSWLSIMAAMPTLVDAVAAASGRSAEEVRQLGVTGKLALAELNEGLRQSVEANEAVAASMPTTVADAVVSLANAWSAYIGEANRANGATDRIVELIGLVRDNLDGLVAAGLKAGQVLVAVFAVRAAIAVKAYTASLLASVAATGAATTATTAYGAASLAAAAQVSALNVALGVKTRALGLVAAVGKGAVTPLVLMTAWASRGAAAVMGVVRALGFLKAAMMGTGIGALVVILWSLISRFIGAKKGAEEMGAAVSEVAENVETLNERLADQAVRRDWAGGIETSAAAAKFALNDLQREFAALLRAGDDVHGAMQKVFDGIDVSDSEGLTSLLSGMESLRAAALVTGEQIEAELVRRLGDISGKDLRDFGIQAEMAFNRGTIGARELRTALDAQVRAALLRLGVDADKALTGMGGRFGEAAEALQVLVGQMERLEAAGVDTGSVLRQAFGAALDTASTAREFDHLARQIEAAGRAGQLTGEQIGAMLADVQNRVKTAMRESSAEVARINTEIAELLRRAGEVRQGLAGAGARAQSRRERGMSDEEREAAAAQRARRLLADAERATTFAQNAALDGRSEQAQRYAREAAELIERAAAAADQIKDDDTAVRLLDRIAEAEARALESQAQVKREQAGEIERRAAEAAEQLTGLEARLQALAEGATVTVRPDTSAVEQALAAVQAAVDAIPAEKTITVRTVHVSEGGSSSGSRSALDELSREATRVGNRR